METYVELIIAALICFKMFEIRAAWNVADKVAVAVHMIAIAVIIWFFFYVVWFVFIKVKPLARMKNRARYKEYAPVIEQTLKEL